MNTSHPYYDRHRGGIGKKTFVLFGLAVLALATSLLVAQHVASAGPSGEGPITVDESGHWFEYAGSGEPYFMAGSGGPEGFLYYSDSDKQDIVDQLIENDVRAIYIHAVRSDGGDGGGNENPFFGNNADNGTNPAVLDQWDAYLSQLDDAGIITWFHLYDDGARPFGACNANLPEEEKAFVKTLVERFRDYQHLVWLPTEEHTIKACGNDSVDIEKAEALAAEIRKYDDEHPLGVHHRNGQSNQYLGNTDIDVFAQQICQQSQFTSVDGIHNAGAFGEDVYVMSECHPWHRDLLDRGERTTLRQSFWSSVMAGGYVLFYDAWESTDPTEDMLADLGRINAFMDTTRFAETAPADQLAAGGTKWVLANEAEDVYIAYANNNPQTMGVEGLSAGTYDIGWFDPVTGVRVDESATVGAGTVTFPVPSQIGSEVALYIEPSGGSQPTTTTITEAPITTTTTAPTGTSDELVAVEDAFIEGTTAKDNGELRVENGSRTRTTYVQFDTSGVASADDVRLRLTVGSDPGNGTLQAWVGNGGSWTAATLTPANAPTPGAEVGSVDGPFTTGQELEIVLPPELVTGNVLDLVLTTSGAGSDDVSFVATEGGDGPTLLLDTTTATGPTVTTPTTTAPTTTVPTGPTTTVVDQSLSFSITQGPLEDAYLQGSTATNNDALRVEHGDRTRTSYLRFDTSEVGGAQVVTLELTVGNDAGAGTVSVWKGTSSDWASSTLSPNNAPVPRDVLATASGSFDTGQTVLFELPANAIDGDSLNLVITHDGVGADDLAFASSETDDGPKLSASASNIDPSTTTTPPTTAAPTTTVTPSTQAPTTTQPPVTDLETVTFQGTNADVPNPERGFHKGASVRDSNGGSNSSVSAMSSQFDDGLRVARMYIRLDDYRNGSIPQRQIDDLDQVFANARAAGIKVIPRFSYNFGSGGDASVERIEQHLEQVTPMLRRNSDVIAVLQAGFIGKWGEWHSSSNGLTNPIDRARVRDALLDALPQDRMTQFRYPDDIIEFDPTPLSTTGAWSGNDASRSGHKNDCFLANEHDAGTYIPLSRKGEFQSYLETMTAFTVMGGETCQVSAGDQRADCTTAVDELDRFNWDYLNIDFYGNTIDKWRADGCFDEISSRLGYRYEMQSAAASAQVQGGGQLALDIQLSNVGFGKLYNPRPMNVVLVNNATGATTRVQRVSDARTVLPLSGDTANLDLSVQVPASMSPGSYSVHVELPDGAASLADDARYSIQMANAGTWRAATGTNDLGLDVEVTG